MDTQQVYKHIFEDKLSNFPSDVPGKNGRCEKIRVFSYIANGNGQSGGTKASLNKPMILSKLCLMASQPRDIFKYS